MAKFHLLSLLAVFLMYFGFASARQESPLTQSETHLQQQYEGILTKNLFEREKASSDFLDSFANVLSLDGSFNYNFTSLPKIGSVYSPDGALRVYTWNIPVGIDEQLYFGVVQYLSHSTGKYKIAKLNEPVGLNQLRKISEWKGALYYEIIETKHAGQKYYTLLGFDLNNSLSNKKLIDIVSVDEYEELYFCEKLIHYNNKKIDRLEFEYSEKAIMSLRYDAEQKMIIFDHLSPAKPSLEGKYEFYGPDFTYDGLKFEKGTWVFYTNIEITN